MGTTTPIQGKGHIKNSTRLKKTPTLKFTSYRIFIPIKFKCHEHSEKAVKAHTQSRLTKFTHEKLFAVVFLLINFRKLKWHQGQASEEDRTRYSASATSECRWNIKDHSNRIKGACEETGHELLQKRICSLPEGHTMGSVFK